MKNTFYLIKVFAIQIFTVPAVILIFKTLESRMLAGLLAGALFIVGALAMIFILKKNKARNWLIGLISTHLLLIAIPMVFFRLLSWEIPFDQVNIWGLPGPEFHKLSERLYSIMMVSTVGEFIWMRFCHRTPQSKVN